MMDDIELLRRYVENGSEEAFAELVRRHVNMVYSAALRRLGNDAQLAEDVTQCVFTALARKAPTLRRHPVLGGWLHRCTRFTVTDAMRAKHRREKHEQAGYIMSDSIEPADAADVGWQRLGPVVDALLDELNERERDAIILRFFEGRSFAEIGAALRVGEDAARMRVNRAIDRLRALLARRGIASSAGALGVALANHATLAAPAQLAGAITGAALAPASLIPASAGGTLVFLKFMSTTKFIAGVATAAAIIGLGLAIRQTAALREARDSATLLTQERDARGQRVRELTAKLAGVEKDNVDLRSSRDALLATKPAAASVKPNAAAGRPLGDIIPPAVSMGFPGVDFNNAEARALVIQDRALKARGQYQRFFRSLGLSAPQQDQLIKILSEQDEALIDLALAMQGMAPTKELELKMKEVGRQIVTDMNAKVQELLGPDGRKQFRQYEWELLLRPVVDQLASQFFDSPTPLTPEQAGQLIRIFDENQLGNLREAASPKNSTGGEKLPANALGLAKLLAGQQNVSWQRFITDAALAKAENILAPPQFEALKRLQAEQIMRIKLAPALLTQPPAGKF